MQREAPEQVVPAIVRAGRPCDPCMKGPSPWACTHALEPVGFEEQNQLIVALFDKMKFFFPATAKLVQSRKEETLRQCRAGEFPDHFFQQLKHRSTLFPLPTPNAPYFAPKTQPAEYMEEVD
jgi:hypothetical protein